MKKGTLEKGGNKANVLAKELGMIPKGQKPEVGVDDPSQLGGSKVLTEEPQTNTPPVDVKGSGSGGNSNN